MQTNFQEVAIYYNIMNEDSCSYAKNSQRFKKSYVDTCPSFTLIEMLRNCFYKSKILTLAFHWNTTCKTFWVNFNESIASEQN